MTMEDKVKKLKELDRIKQLISYDQVRIGLTYTPNGDEFLVIKMYESCDKYINIGKELVKRVKEELSKEIEKVKEDLANDLSVYH